MLTTLDKVKRLEQYLAVDNSTVDPVVNLTIDKRWRENEREYRTQITQISQIFISICVHLCASRLCPQIRKSHG